MEEYYCRSYSIKVCIPPEEEAMASKACEIHYRSLVCEFLSNVVGTMLWRCVDGVISPFCSVIRFNGGFLLTQAPSSFSTQHWKKSSLAAFIWNKLHGAASRPQAVHWYVLLQLALNRKEYRDDQSMRTENKIFSSINLSLQRQLETQILPISFFYDTSSCASDGQMWCFPDERRWTKNVQRLINGRERFVDC